MFKISLPKKMSPLLAEEIGLHYGDGSMNYYAGKGLYQLRGHIEDDSEHYLNFIKPLYNTLYGLNLNIRKMPSTGVIGFQVWNNELVKYKNEMLGICLGKKVLSLPDYLRSKKLFFPFIRGLFDTDGSIYWENKRGKPYPRLDIKSTSRELSSEITALLNDYGINTSHYEYKRANPNWQPLCSVVVRGYPMLTKWFDLIGSNNPKHERKMAWWIERN